jgi:4-alpha-glucanotransferase
MSSDGHQNAAPPFAAGYRASGVLLHVASLPSRYGIGDIGPGAVAWIDRLHEAGQSWWQALPLGPTGYGNSPYQSLSSFAGNELLISPDWLIEDGLLQPDDSAAPPLSATSVDYGAVIPLKRRLLATAWSRFRGGACTDLRRPYGEFCEVHRHWLEDYAAFRALKAAHNGAYYLHWPPELARRETQALAAARRQLAEPIDQVRFAQFLLFRQAERLKAHSGARHIQMIGDLPFFVSPDSSDVWADPEMFLLDEERRPRVVAGVPPDYFSAQGQLWGNPVYDWEAAHHTGYRWYLDRLRALLAHVDIVRLDHFRGFAAAWQVPFGAPTAQTGQWVPGPGAALFHAISDRFSELPFIAEDLGLITPDVAALRDQFQLPSTRVLQFAFDGRPDNPHLPENYSPNTVAYTGTHDNPTTRGWFEELSEPQRQMVWGYLKRPGGATGEAAAALIETAWSSPAALAIAPLQDLLNLGNEARMNMPGRADGNWCWRCSEEMLTPAVFQRLHDVTCASHRLQPR